MVSALDFQTLILSLIQVEVSLPCSLYISSARVNDLNFTAYVSILRLLSAARCRYIVIENALFSDVRISDALIVLSDETTNVLDLCGVPFVSELAKESMFSPSDGRCLARESRVAYNTLAPSPSP